MYGERLKWGVMRVEWCTSKLRHSDLLCNSLHYGQNISADKKVPKDGFCSYSQCKARCTDLQVAEAEIAGRACHGSTSVLLVKKWESESLPMLVRAAEYASVITALLSSSSKSWAHIPQVFMTQLQGSELLRLLLALALDMMVCLNMQR